MDSFTQLLILASISLQQLARAAYRHRKQLSTNVRKRRSCMHRGRQHPLTKCQTFLDLTAGDTTEHPSYQMLH
jgi:hypothetical protein